MAQSKTGSKKCPCYDHLELRQRNLTLYNKSAIFRHLKKWLRIWSPLPNWPPNLTITACAAQFPSGASKIMFSLIKTLLCTFYWIYIFWNSGIYIYIDCISFAVPCNKLMPSWMIMCIALKKFILLNNFTMTKIINEVNHSMKICSKLPYND